MTNETPINAATTGAIVAAGVEMSIQSGDKKLSILKDINWSIPKGDIQLLMGPSGSGKTTLISVLTGLLTPTAGRVYLLGEEITRMSRSKLAQFRRQHVGFIFQDFNLFPALTVQENVETALNIQGIWRKQARDRAQTMLDHVGIGDKAKLLPRQLSGGQKQRVAIARALVNEPQLVIADEPTASLDSQTGHTVMELLRRLAKEEGCTVLMVSHDPRIMDVADRIAYLEDGVLKE